MALAIESRTVKKVKIWQFLDLQLGCWRYFSPGQCKCLQDAKNSNQSTINLDGKLSVNFPNCEMEIITSNSKQSGNPTIMPIRQVDVSIDSSIAKGIIWEWNFGRNEWIAFTEDANNLIEDEFGKGKKRRKSSSNLVKLAIIGLPYTIDVAKKCQRNIHSDRVRTIRRQEYSSYLDVLPIVDVVIDEVQDASINQQQTSDNTQKNNNHHQNSASANVSGNLKNSLSVSERNKHNQKYGSLANYILLVANDNLPDEPCIICFELLSAVSGFETQDENNCQIVQLSQCQHYFHEPCIEACVKNSKSDYLECPKCRTLHGLKTGNQPKGNMTHQVQEGMKIPGFKSSSAIIITYDFRDGVQGPEHPHPGKKYRASAFPRVAYLPNNPEGQNVLRMLKLAWERRLIFTIGRSSTTGIDNVIIWNDIHHKTSWNNNYGGHGYPDPDYLKRITEELQAHGIR